MIEFLSDLLGGWKELRVQQGYSYQVNRSGKRRIVAVADYGRFGSADRDWLISGQFSDEQIHKRFRNYDLAAGNRARTQAIASC